MRSIILAVLLCGIASPAVARQTAELSGRVIERNGEAGIAGATIEVAGRTVLTDLRGRFTITELTAGRHVLTVGAFGYSVREVEVTAPATDLVIELDPSPVALDPLVVTGATITLRGKVHERGDDRGLIDVQVLVDPDHEEWTNSAGRFKVDDLPAGPPLRLEIRGFGYLPIHTIISAFRDTTLIIGLEPDPLMQRMIEIQAARLRDRAKPFDTAVMPAMDREDLLRNANTTAFDLIRYRYGRFLSRVKCMLIDDRQTYNGLAELMHFLPDELERIEFLFRGRMLRIYTRDYMRKLVGGGVELVRPVYVEYGSPPLCR